jgi:cell division protein FtsZ
VTDAFLVADDILRQGVVGISEIILKTGLVNVVDFADVRAIMKDAGTLMGGKFGVGRTELRMRPLQLYLVALGLSIQTDRL